MNLIPTPFVPTNTNPSQVGMPHSDPTPQFPAIYGEPRSPIALFSLISVTLLNEVNEKSMVSTFGVSIPHDSLLTRPSITTFFV